MRKWLCPSAKVIFIFGAAPPRLWVESVRFRGFAAFRAERLYLSVSPNLRLRLRLNDKGLTRGAGVGIKPGVKRSVTPGDEH